MDRIHMESREAIVDLREYLEALIGGLITVGVERGFQKLCHRVCWSLEELEEAKQLGLRNSDHP